MTTKKLIHENGGQPLWSQLFDILEERIESGYYPPNSLMPGEMELAEEFGVSRITVRQAMDKLRNESYIERKRGIGTIVRPKVAKVSTSFVSSFNGTESHHRDDRRVISQEYVRAPLDVAYFFGIPVNQPVLLLVRMSYMEDKPITYYETYLALSSGLDDTMDFSGSLYDLLDENGYEINHIVEKISAHVSTKKERELFELNKNTAIINRIRMGSSNGTPIEYTFSQYVSDGYELTVERG